MNKVFRAYSRLGAGYILLAVSGLAGLVWPPPTLYGTVTQGIAVYFWCGGIFIGGVLCCIGRWRNITGPKLVGLALIMIDLLAFALSVFATTWSRMASGLFILGFVFILGERWIHAYDTRRSRLRTLGTSGTGGGPDLVAYARNRLTRHRLNRGRFDLRWDSDSEPP